jgi:hypothetical protein
VGRRSTQIRDRSGAAQEEEAEGGGEPTLSRGRVAGTPTNPSDEDEAAATTKATMSAGKGVRVGGGEGGEGGSGR